MENRMDRELLLQRLAALHVKVEEAGDHVNARKILDILHKVHDEEYMIGFFGHFSAGKSSLLNYLFSTDLLPTSPIPTSANVVKLSTGGPKAYITLTNGDVIELEPPFHMKDFQRYCTDGEQIQLVELRHPIDRIPEGVALFDTPGIDSTDNAHRLATESILHLADCLFYVMDYNHVLSELNFTFTKLLQERGLKLYWIINQIDKHQEQETSFDQYKQHIDQAIERWGIQPVKIFYTSVHHRSFPHNELQKLEMTLAQMMRNRQMSILEHANRAVQYILHEHEKWLEEQDEQLETEETTLSEEEIKHVEQKYASLCAEKEALEGLISRWIQETEQGLQKILYNSSLMPYETRELAKAYLESTQPNYKVGFFASRKKTDEERDRRLQALYEDVKGRVKAQLDWHIKSLIQQQFEQLSIHNPEVMNTIQNWEVTLGQDIFVQAVKKDAHISGDYLLNYTKEVVETIKQWYRRHALQLLDEVKKAIELQNRSKIQEIVDHLKQIEPTIQKIESVRKAKQHRKEQIEQLQQVMKGLIDERTLQLAIKLLEQQSKTKETRNTITANEVTLEFKSFADEELFESSAEVQSQEKVEHRNRTEYLNNAVDTLHHIASTVEGIAGFHEDVHEMRLKAKRIEDRQFTIALFGAFSAGKSSFANALMGAELLPTSPNPTTAAITKIHPPTMQYPNGTIRVKFKSEQQLLDEANILLQFVQQSSNTFVGALELLDQLEEHRAIRPYTAFISALQTGYIKYVDRFDSIFEGTITDLPTYAAVEENAVFVEWIEIYYDSPLTQQGISLVDTPGADSIHTRHTGVAFEYIKNADAIIYITYYNHAFSQADQLFLQQLGRVKDTFELDKMFFIINAADLARSDEELVLVKQHIQKNLRVNGVQNARLYAVSSKLALAAKLGASEEAEQLLKKSHFSTFEQDFQAFMVQDLLKNVSVSVYHDLERILHKLDVFISSAEQSVEVRERKLQQTIENHAKMLDRIKGWDTSLYERNVQQEVEELLYYVQQRLQMKMRDYFKISFSPAVLRKDVKDIKQALKDALHEWLQFLEQHFVQELQATSLRIEKYIRHQIKLGQNGLTEQLIALDGEVMFAPFEVGQITSIQIKNVQMISDLHTLYPLLSSFKNQRQFFEDGGNEQMLEELSKALQSPIAEMTEQWKATFKDYYVQAMKQLFIDAQSYLSKQVDAYYTGQKEVLSASDQLELYRQAFAQLSKLSQQQEEAAVMLT